MPTRAPNLSNSGSRVFGYLLSEKTRLGRADLDIHGQRQVVRGWATGRGIEVDEFFDEYGFKPDDHFGQRVEARKLLAVVRRGDTVVAAKFDRLFGVAEDAHATLTMAREIGVHFLALDVRGGNLEENRSIDAILLAVSAANSNYRKSVAARRVKNREAESGNYRGGHPEFGATATERAHIAVLLDMRTGGASFRALEGFSKEAGFPLSHAGIRNLLKRHVSDPDQN